MRPLSLFNLLRNNAKRGEFRAEGNTIWLYDVIVGSEQEAEWFGGVSAEAFIRQLRSMTGPVALRINSPGGEVFAAVAMAQAMREYTGEITVHVDGLAASAATFLAIAGAKCVMATGSFMMIHKACTMAWGESDELRQTADLLDKIDGSIAGQYAAKGKADQAAFFALMAAETWLTPDEAIALGLADEVSAASQTKPSNIWDLSAFRAAPPVEAAPTPEVQNDTVTVTVVVTVEDDDDQPAEPAIDPNPVPAVQDAERRARIHAVRLLAPAA